MKHGLIIVCMDHSGLYSILTLHVYKLLLYNVHVCISYIMASRDVADYKSSHIPRGRDISVLFAVA